MTIKARCPGCSAAFNLGDDKQGKKIRCPKCQEIFTASAAGQAKPNGAKQAAIQPKPAAVKKAVRGEDEEDQRFAAQKARPAAIDDRDDEDEEQPRGKPAPRRTNGGSPDLKKAQSNPGLMLGIIGGGAVLLLLLLGGGGLAVYLLFFNKAAPSTPTSQEAKTPDPSPPSPPPSPAMTVDAALQGLASGDQSKSREALNWLTTATVDKNRQADVSRALNPLLKSPDVHMREQTVSALKVWGATKENLDGLLQILNDANALAPQNPDLIVGVLDLVGPLQDERAVEPVWRYRVTGHLTDQADRALQAMGPAAGEKAALKRMDDSKKYDRDAARNLLVAYKTADSAKLAQVKADLTAPDKATKLAACDYLTTTPVVQAERPGVAQALNAAVNDPDHGVVEAAVKAVGAWYTADNVETLAAAIGQDDFRERAPAMVILGKLKDQRGAVAVIRRLNKPFEDQMAHDSLVAMGDVAVPELEKAAGATTDGGYRDRIDRVLKEIKGSASGAELAAAISDLSSPNGGRRADAARALIKMPVDPAQQAKVAAALEAAAKDNSDRGAQEWPIRALSVWGTKDNGPALVKIFTEKNNGGRNFAMEAAADLKYEDAIVPIGQCMFTGDREAARDAFIAYGPDFGAKIEPIVWGVFQTNDGDLIRDGCRVLSAVGTKKSVAVLEVQIAKYTQQKNGGMATATEAAFTAIRTRLAMK